MKHYFVIFLTLLLFNPQIILGSKIIEKKEKNKTKIKKTKDKNLKFKFCWKETVLRGVGTIPLKCKKTETLKGLLCYKKCVAGTKRFGFDCHTVCPKGFKNDGLYCRAKKISKGKKNCPKGFEVLGGHSCKPVKQPDCKSFGLLPGTGISCLKKIIRHKPHAAKCSANKELDAGLCYSKCPQGFKGIGPVCWQNKGPFPGWKLCGMGYAKDKGFCTTITSDQVLSVARFAIFLGSFGTSGTIELAFKALKPLSMFLKPIVLKSNDFIEKVKEAHEKKIPLKLGKKTKPLTKERVTELWNKLGKKFSSKMKSLKSIFEDKSMKPDERSKKILGALKLFDISNTLKVTDAYLYPKCNKLKLDYLENKKKSEK